MLLCLLWFSGCSIKNFLWIYSEKSAEEFVLFCDLKETKKSRFYHRNPFSLAQGPERRPCHGGESLSDAQWYLQPREGGALQEITRNQSQLLLDKMTLRFLTVERSNAGSYICRPRIRYVPNAFLPENIPSPSCLGLICVHGMPGAPAMRPAV